jgi:hypothetical protein
MGDNSEVFKAIRLMNDNPKYWILSSRAIMVGSDKNGTPILSPDENCFKNKIVITIPEKYPNSMYEWVAKRCSDGYHRWSHTATYDNTIDLSDLAKEYDEWKSISVSHEQLHRRENSQVSSNSSKYEQYTQQSSLNRSITDFLKGQHIYYSSANQFDTMFGKAGCPSKTPGKDCINRIYITCPMSDDDYETKYRKSSHYEVNGRSKFWTVMKTSDGRYYWEELGDINFQEEAKKALEDENPVLEFKDHVKHDPMTKSDIVRLFIKMRPQLEKYICHIETKNKDPWVVIQHFPKLDNYDKFLYQDEFGNISMVDYDEQLGYHQFNLFNLKDCDKFSEDTNISSDFYMNDFRDKIRNAHEYSEKCELLEKFDWYTHIKFAGVSKNKYDEPSTEASKETANYLYFAEYNDNGETVYLVFCTFRDIYNHYYWEYICTTNDCKPYIHSAIESTIELIKAEQKKADEERKRIFEFQKEYAWKWTAHDAGWYNGSDAGHFSININNNQTSIFNNVSTANIGHDKEDIDDILKESTTSAVKPDSISQRLKYMKMKEKKYGNSITQNITVNGDNNTVIGISMTQTSKDDCEQTQTVVIKNSKSEKKKEKRETVLGTLHKALINLAKIIETYTKYLLDHCFDFFD